MAIAGVSDDMCFAQRVGVFFDVDAFTAFSDEDVRTVFGFGSLFVLFCAVAISGTAWESLLPLP